MQTATIEVKYVNQPKEGKQYGSIKAVSGDSWPVKKERIREFEEGNTYALAYTEGNNGFRNIIGVKRIVQPEPQGDFQQVSEPQRPAQQAKAPANGNYYRPTSPRDSERMWTCATLGHFIDRGSVELNEDALTHAVNMLRAVYQKTYGQDDA